MAVDPVTNAHLFPFRPNVTIAGNLLMVLEGWYTGNSTIQPQVTNLRLNGTAIPIPSTTPVTVSPVATITVGGVPPYNFTITPLQNDSNIMLTFDVRLLYNVGGVTYDSGIQNGVLTFAPLTSDLNLTTPTPTPDFVDVTTQGVAITGRFSTEGAPNGPYAIVPATLTPSTAGTLVLLNPTTGTFSFIPNPTFTGTAGFQFTTNGGSTTLQGAIEVEPTINVYPAGLIVVPENTTAVVTPLVGLTNPTFQLHGADANRFQINPVTYALEFRSPPDFETPLDSNRDNVYEVQVIATSDEGTRTRTLTQVIQVRVTDLGGPPINLPGLASPIILTTPAGVPLQLPGVTLEVPGTTGAQVSQINGVALTGALQVIPVTGGVVRVLQGVVTFTPNPNFTGVVTIPFAVTTVGGATPTTGTLVIRVTPGLRPPVGRRSRSRSSSRSSACSSQSSTVDCRPVRCAPACPVKRQCCTNYAPWILLLISIIIVAVLVARKRRMIRF
jgi:hypothetical protein